MLERCWKSCVLPCRVSVLLVFWRPCLRYRNTAKFLKTVSGVGRVRISAMYMVVRNFEHLLLSVANLCNGVCNGESRAIRRIYY